MIKSVKLSLEFLNKNKLENLISFIDEYKRVIKLVLIDTKELELLPKYLDYKPYSKSTWFSARSLRRIVDHAIQIEKSIRKSKTNKAKKYNSENINPSLNSTQYDIEPGNFFDEFLRLKCLGDKLSIKIPLNYHRLFRKWNSLGKRMSGIEINERFIKINFEVSPKKSKSTKRIGIDQGIKKVVTTSDGQKLPKECTHGHSLESVIEKLARKKKGSKGFKKAQKHRTNFINWSVNQLNLDSIGVVALERVKHFFNGKNRGRRTSHWAYSLIRRKVIDYAQEHGVRVVEQSSQYRSQRCSSCGYVKKSNREGESFNCSECGLKIDSDLNAALNHETILPEIGFIGGLNKSGFFWNPILI